MESSEVWRIRQELAVYNLLVEFEGLWPKGLPLPLVDAIESLLSGTAPIPVKLRSALNRKYEKGSNFVRHYSFFCLVEPAASETLA